jgi:hypothetical protein
MAHDLSKPYDYPFELPPEDEIRFKDAGAVEGRPAGVPHLTTKVAPLAGHLRQFLRFTRWRN